jgi:hypothetical protein
MKRIMSTAAPAALCFLTTALFAANAFSQQLPDRTTGEPVFTYGAYGRVVPLPPGTYSSAAHRKHYAAGSHSRRVPAAWCEPPCRIGDSGGQWEGYPGWRWNGDPGWHWDGYPRWLWHG